MLVRNWMSKNLVSIAPDESMAKANRLLSDNHIGRLPVIDDRGNLVGIVSDRDLKRAGASDATSLDVHELAYLLTKVKVSDIMTANPLTIREYETIDEAAQLMLENKISGLPVENDLGKVVAVLTQNDIFLALVRLTGVQRGGAHLALNLPDKSGSIKGVCDLIREFDGRLISILTSYDQAPDGERKVYIRVANLSHEKMSELCPRICQLGDIIYLRENHTRIFDCQARPV